MIHGSLGVWESLIYPDENLEPQPVLAAGWESNDDATEWTIHLREGIVFHDGTPFNAEIAAANLLSAHENYTPIATLDRIEVVDDLTLKIFLSEPTPALMALLSNYSSAQFSPATFEQADAEVPMPYGSGPYKFESYTDGEQIVLVRNKDYWGEPAKTERIIYRFIPDANTRIMALQSGEIDAIIDVGALIPSQGQLIEQTEGLVLATQDVVTTHYLFFNNDKAPLDNVVLRQAISMAIDRELITQEAVYGYGLPAVSNITPLSTEWVNPDAKPVFDPEQANVLAQSVLGDERLDLTLVISSSLANRWPYAEIAQIIQAELAEIGIDLEIEMVEGGTWNEKLANDDYDMSIRPYTLSSGDPDDFMSYWARENGSFNTKYSISYSDTQVEALIADAISETDHSQRQALYAQLQMIFADQVPFTPIYHEQSLFAYNELVKDLTMDASFKPALEKVYKLVP
jgi:peptide/nickel transport system substrate-binding protein